MRCGRNLLVAAVLVSALAEGRAKSSQLPLAKFLQARDVPIGSLLLLPRKKEGRLRMEGRCCNAPCCSDGRRCGHSCFPNDFDSCPTHDMRRRVGGGIPPRQSETHVVPLTLRRQAKTSTTCVGGHWYFRLVKFLRGLSFVLHLCQCCALLRKILVRQSCPLQPVDANALYDIRKSRTSAIYIVHLKYTMPTLKPRRRPKIIRVSASSAAALIACSAAVPDEVTSTAPAAASDSSDVGSLVTEAVPEEVVSATSPSEKCSYGKSKRRSDASTRKTVYVASKSKTKKRKHEQTADVVESQKEPQPRSAAIANTRNTRTKSKTKKSKPATLVRRGDVQHEYAANRRVSPASTEEHRLSAPRESRRCKWPQGCGKHQNRSLSFPEFPNHYCSGHFYEFARRAGPKAYNRVWQLAKEKRKIAREKRRSRAEASASAAAPNAAASLAASAAPAMPAVLAASDGVETLVAAADFSGADDNVMRKCARPPRPKNAKPATLIRRRDIKHKYAASLQEHFFRADWKSCRNEDNRETKCKCHRSVDGAFLSAIEEYVDSTWKDLSFTEQLAVAKAQSPVESCGVRGKFYMPFENGSQFHPVCPNTFCRLLGCPAKQFPQIKRALTDRDWLAHRN